MKVLFVGLGGVGQRHLRNLVEIMGNNVEIYAYRVRKAKFVLNNKLEVVENEELETKYNIHVLDDIDAAWKIGVECVFICNPTSLHMNILLSAVENGCHIFVEKPLSHNMDSIDRLERVVEEKNLITFVGYQNRFHPCIKKAKYLLETKAIGDIVKVTAEIGENVKNWHKYEDYKNMYACRKDLGGGVVLSQIHELDYIISFFGMPQSVYAVGGKNSDLEIDVEDAVDILLKYKIKDKNVPVCIREDYIQNPPTRNCKIVGTKGRIEFDLLKSNVLMYDENGTLCLEKTYEFERNEMFVEEMKIFLEALNSKEVNEKVIPISEGIKSLRVALAVKDSMEKNQIIEL